MKNSKESNFSVNVPLTEADIVELKKLILSFVNKTAEEQIVSFYREKKNTKSGIMIGEKVSVGDPTDEELNQLLDHVKGQEVKPLGECGQAIKVTLSLPLGSS